MQIGSFKIPIHIDIKTLQYFCYISKSNSRCSPRGPQVPEWLRKRVAEQNVPGISFSRGVDFPNIKYIALW